MIYYNLNDIVVRDMIESDPEIITTEEHLQGWVDQEIDKYLKRLQDVANGKCTSLVAEYKGNVAGYINVYPNAMWGAFGGKGLPEIVDLGVLQKYRQHGIGTILMQIAENIAGKYADTVYLGVGINKNYGAAQRLYAKRGFIPDGTGLWYKNKVLEPYADMKNDDDAAIYMLKKLY
ncbi:MAG: GNAT family N-acetyltransferase [Alphaproteobacteria bacterium]|nr:GNAT family N-acetyltransferase [Alphaproteobacteria bacterium]